MNNAAIPFDRPAKEKLPFEEEELPFYALKPTCVSSNP